MGRPDAPCEVQRTPYPFIHHYLKPAWQAQKGDLEGRRRKARKRGKGKGVSLSNNCSIPLPFSLAPYPLPLSSPESNLPLSTPATQATLTKKVPFRKGLHWRMVSLSQTYKKPGAPNDNFRKISVPKTIWDLEFSEHLLGNFLLACLS